MGIQEDTETYLILLEHSKNLSFLFFATTDSEESEYTVLRHVSIHYVKQLHIHASDV